MDDISGIVGVTNNTDVSICGNETFYNNTNGTCNETLDSPVYELPHSLWLTILLGTAASIVIVVTVLGNILVLLSFFLERSIRQPTNYFIASLAMSDLLIGTFSMPCFTLYLLLGRWPLGEIICDLWLSLDWTVCLASQYTVFFITADRFCSVTIPAKYRNWRTDRKVRVMIALSWIIPSVVFFTSIIGWQFFVGKRTVAENECEVQFMSDPTFIFLLTIGYFWSTLFVMITLYVGIYRVALKLQRKSNEKHKKMQNAMDLSKGKSKSGGAKSKDSRKRIENNNARYLRGANENNTLTTSFSKHSDNEYSKPSEEDRSSSPAFASDDEENSSGEIETQKTSCYVNSAVQTEPTIRGMMGSTVNHMSKLAFSLSGTSVSASQVSQSSAEKDSSDEHPSQNQHGDNDQIKPLLSKKVSNTFKSIDSDSVDKPSDGITSKNQDDENKITNSAAALMDSDILDGIRYIDEDSLKSLTSADNMKLLAEIKDMPLSPSRKNEPDSPVWRKRAIEDDKSLLVPNSGDSASSEALSSVIDTGYANKTANDRQCNSKATENSRPHHRHRKHDHKKNNLRVPHKSDSNDKKSKDKRPYGSPLQSLVRSLRPSANKKGNKNKTKSKSENRARKALRTISIILGAYVLCWTPYHVMVFIIGICKSWDCINIQFYYFTYWLCYLNSPINPFCYAFANAQFKRTFIRILKLDFHRT
ncbi:muscarinic acetylcholine receptor M1-like [Mya arenaria]|uniref:muscarinic acetylcholine receptor M1-like n=1 Tax=Mya arenaria TaxID=6604 RepID=UPI0022E8FD4F|nr:muscarinic acetylcholine receptor M1-like [Mya arenaria]XP_052803501.1 muscarinic acetylcholine receptor M1-like [Mya arenaria]